MQKLLLSGIPKNFNNITIIGNTLEDDRYRYEETIVDRKILYADEDLVFFNGNKHKTLKDFQTSGNRLDSNGLGQLKQLKKNASSSKVAHCFQKFNFNELTGDERLDAQNSLIKFHVDIEKYKKLFLKRKYEDINDLDHDDDNPKKKDWSKK